MLGINEALKQMFDRNRVVFWYDSQEELRQEFEGFDLPGVTSVTVKPGKFFGLKYKILRESREEKFLLYCPFEVPDPRENGLLDIQMSYDVFRADKASLYLQELGLGMHLHRIVQQHLSFFESKERREKLKHVVDNEISEDGLRMEMLSVVFNTYSTSLEDFIPAYTHEILDPGKYSYTHQLDRYALTEFFWDEIQKAYGYAPKEKSFYDLILFLFSQGSRIESSTVRNRDVLILLSGWQDSTQHRGVYQEISRRVSNDQNIRSKLPDAPFENLLREDLFQVIDEYLIEEWSAELCQPEPNVEDILQGLKMRQSSFWYEHYKSIYQALEAATWFLKKVDEQEFTIPDFQMGVEKYTEIYSTVDYHYRKFIYFWQEARENQLFADLYEKISKTYSNGFLMELSRSWQKVIDKAEKSSQLFQVNSSFYDNEVRGFVDKGQRIFVIISDAFRYEIGREFISRITKENRYQADMSYRISSFPSYTQLGMAVLLPHEKVEIQEGSESVLVDGANSQGLEARKKIIANAGKGTAINAEDFMRFSRDEGREFVRDLNVIYIFHNSIDKAGDDKTTESQVLKAAEDEMEYLISVIKAIAGFNGVNMVLTADHGFIYDHNALHESEFLNSVPGGKIWKKNRRFVIGQDLKPQSGYNIFEGQTLGLQKDIQVAFPKELKRIRISGSGSRFVHGGLSLQEIVVPVVKIRKLRTDTVMQTHVDIIHQSTDITNNIRPIHFIQSDAVGSNVLPRTIKAYFKAPDGEILTDIFEKTFESRESENRNREVIYRFHFSSKASTQYRNKKIQLVMEEPIEGSSQYKVYKSFDFRMRTIMETDF